MFDELNFSGRRRLPMIFQAEAMECGLACVTMIARYHGNPIDLNTLRQQFSVSRRGATLRHLLEVAAGLSLAARPVRVELDQLQHLQLPAVLHWNFTHFVVLKSFSQQGAVIHDPAAGVRQIGLKELSRSFTGVALELSPIGDIQYTQPRARAKISQLWSKITGLEGAIFHLIALSAMVLLATLAMPLFMQMLVDQVLLTEDRSVLLVVTLAFGGVFVIGALSELIRAWAVLYYGSVMTYQMVGNLFHHLIRLPVSYFEKRHVGDILSRLQSTTPIQQALTEGLATALLDGVFGVFLLVLMFSYSPLLAATAVAFTAMQAIATLVLFPKIRIRQEEQLVASAREHSHIIESVRAAPVIKVARLEAERESAWRNLYGNSINAIVSVGRLQAILAFCRTFCFTGQMLAVGYLAIQLTIDGQFTVGMIFAFASFSQQFFQRSDTFMTQAVKFRLLNLHVERISDIVEAEVERDSEGEWTSEDPRGEIVARDISFRYGTGEPWVLRNLSLRIEPQELVAITGVSGGGKSTLLKLLIGIYAPEEGEILVEGTPLARYGARNWRQHLGVVMQNDTLLSGTIASNIASFDPDMDIERVHQAAMTARVHDDIMRLPMNYLSTVGDMGSSLSGGQQQRVLLARALYRKPRILLLDEGTANLDPKTETDIVSAIKAMDITRIVIAHRPALIDQADRVFRLADGQVEEVAVGRLARVVT